MDNERRVPDEEIIVLTDEEGNEHEFTIVQVLKVDDKEYAILLPINADEAPEDSEDVVILRIDHEGDEDVLVEIEDEDEFERVAEAWDELLDEYDMDADPEDMQ